MKILHYIPSIDCSSGGVGVFMQLLSRDLGKLCELHIVTHKTEMMLELENCMLHFIPLNNNPFSNKSKKEFLTLLNEIKPDVFHVNCCWLPQSAKTTFWAKSLGYKVVYSSHGMLEPWIMERNYWIKKLPAIILYQKKALQVADVIHATAESEAENLINLRWNSNVRVISNCVQVESIPLKTSWERKRKVLFLSRVHVKKGIEFLIDSVTELKEKMANYKIIIAGPGEEEYVESLKKRVKTNCLDDMFDFVGQIFGNDKWRLYQDADVFVLPTYSENFGIVVPEALASGTPVVTTQGTPWEELNSHSCGWCVPIGKEPLVDALKSFLAKTPEELKVMGLRGRTLVEDKYSSEKVARQFVEMYESLISNNSDI